MELTEAERETLGQAMADNRVRASMLSRIDEAVAAFEAGAANAGDPFAVVVEVRAILDGTDDTDPDPLDRTVRDLWCAGCGTHSGPFVVHTETEVCLGCHDALSEAL